MTVQFLLGHQAAQVTELDELPTVRLDNTGQARVALQFEADQLRPATGHDLAALCLSPTLPMGRKRERRERATMIIRRRLHDLGDGFFADHADDLHEVVFVIVDP